MAKDVDNEQQEADEAAAPKAGERLAAARRELQISVLEIAKELAFKVTDGDQVSDVAGVFKVKSGLGFEVKTQQTVFEQASFQVSSGDAGLMVANTCQVGLDSGAGAKIFLNGDELVIQANNITLKAGHNITLKANLAIKLDGLNVQETSSAFITMNA